MTVSGSEMQELYIIGAGGFGREIAWLIERINEKEPTWDLAGFVDDDRNLWGKEIGGYQVVGGCDYLRSLDHDVWAVCAVGASRTRKKIIDSLAGAAHLHYATVIDPSVQMSKRVQIGEGTMICAGNIITVDVTIGKHAIINLDCTIGHDAVLGDYVTLYPSVNVSGCTTVGAESELGTGMQTIQGMKIGSRAILGAGAVVVREIPDHCVAVGSPARPIRFPDD